MSSLTPDHLIRHLTLRQLQIFEAVVRLGGYTRAAETLHLTQPTISAQIRKLTESLGVQLLEQVGRDVRPTPAGRDVFLAAQEILERLATLGETTAERERVVKGPLRIAVVTTAKYFMPHLLGAFISRYPKVVPHLTVTNRAKVLQRIKTGEDDLLIMGQVPGDLPVVAVPFLDNELVVVAPPNHPLVGERNISLARLNQERFLVREPGSGTRQAMDRLFAAHDLKITPYMELGSSEAIKQGVIAGLGLSVISLHSLRLELAGRHLAVLDVQEFPLQRRWYAAHLKGRHLSLAARTFLEFILHESRKVLAREPAQLELSHTQAQQNQVP